MCDFPGCPAWAVVKCDSVLDNKRHEYCRGHFERYHRTLGIEILGEENLKPDILEKVIAEFIAPCYVQGEGLTEDSLQKLASELLFKLKSNKAKGIISNILMFEPGLKPYWYTFEGSQTDLVYSLKESIIEPIEVKSAGNILISYSKTKNKEPKNLIKATGNACMFKQSGDNMEEFKEEDINDVIEFIRIKDKEYRHERTKSILGIGG